MSAEEFWKDDPQLFESYRISFINKKKRELEETDYKCWLEGLYNYDGNMKLLASLKQFFNNILAGMFKGKKDNTKIETYPTRPYGELRRLKKEELKQLEKKKKYDEFQSDLVYFGTLKQQFAEKMKNKQKK